MKYLNSHLLVLLLQLIVGLPSCVQLSPLKYGGTCTGWCKRNVPCLKIPAPTTATQLGLPWTAQSANFGKF